MIHRIILSLHALIISLPVYAASRCATVESVMATGRVQAVSPDATALGLTVTDTGLRIAAAYGLVWPQQCSVVVQHVAYGWGITDHSIAVMVTAGRLFARKMKISPPLPEEGTPPRLPDAVFSGSASVVSGRWRAGVWRYADGHSVVAVYRPKSTDSPRQILQSAVPILGLSYLPAPDTRGGAYTVWQKLSDKSYRVIMMNWTEDGL
ncbi:hypothetical protein [Acetobacter cibinongensis]|nr:hypothetical protein [Acetobacter cibinongensis]